MVRPILLTSIAPIVFLLSGVPVQGGDALQSRKITIFLNLTTWLWAAFSIAIIAIIFHAFLLIASIKAFFMHLNKHPSYLFSKEPVGDARTGLVFCTLVVLTVLLSTAYFPLLMVFVIVPTQNDDTSIPFFAPTLAYMVINLSEALGVGALLALVSHRRYLHFGKEEKMLWKKILDLAIVAFMIIFLVIWTVVYCLPSIYFDSISGNFFGTIFLGPDSHTLAILNLGAASSHLLVVFYSLAIIDVFVSAEFLRRKLREARIHDQVIYNLYSRASRFFIPFAIFNIIEEILSWSSFQSINYDALTFADVFIQWVVGFYGYAWLLRVFFPGKTRIFGF